MKLQAILVFLLCAALPYSANAQEKSCAADLGKKNSEILVSWCLNVSPATRPPCNSANACSLITDEIKRGCEFLEKEKNPPYYCLLTYQNKPR